MPKPIQLMCNLKEHARQGACYMCCSLCNYDRHLCPGCGVPLDHDQGVCDACRETDKNPGMFD